MNPKNKRRLFPLVNRSHQYRFLATILTYNLLIVAFLAMALFVPDIIKQQDQDLSIEMRAEAADKILTLHSRVWPAIITLVCLIGMHSFRVFHRFVGPLYRFVLAFEHVRDGDLSFRVNVRKNDYLLQEARALNEMFDKIKEKLKKAQVGGLAALKSLGELERDAMGKNHWVDADMEKLTMLHGHLDDVIESVQYFRLPETTKIKN